MVEIIEPQKLRMHSVTIPWVPRPFIVGREKDLRSSGWEIEGHLEGKVWAWVRWTLGWAGPWDELDLGMRWTLVFLLLCCLVANLCLTLLKPARLLCPWNFPGKNMVVGCHFLFQGIFLTQKWICISCLTGGFFTIEPWGKPLHCLAWLQFLIGELRSHKPPGAAKKKALIPSQLPFFFGMFIP